MLAPGPTRGEHVPKPMRSTVRRCGLGVSLALAVCLFAAAGAQAAVHSYVSLGDSFTAGPFIPHATGNPILCGRSTNNYPSDVARALHLSSVTDVSCVSATTVNMTQPQPLDGGVQTAPPQFNALSASDALVTVGIGGNDAGLIGVAETCAAIDLFHPFGTACQDHYTSGGSDPNVAAVNATGPNVAAVIQGIHQRAPHARVLVVGYPDGLPVNGSACWPLVPLSAGDITYFNSLERRLNAVLRIAAGNDDATYVNTFTSSIGHDACRPPGTAWINGIVPTSPGYPLHPNQAGEQNMAKQVLGDL
jgi:lysophospholipase L1-like esterase